MCVSLEVYLCMGRGVCNCYESVCVYIPELRMKMSVSIYQRGEYLFAGGGGGGGGGTEMVRLIFSTE